MRCPACGGSGISCIVGEDWCRRCNGTGDAKVSNEEWFESLPTKEKAEVLHILTTACYVCGKDGVDYKRCHFGKECAGPKEIQEWLEQDHKEWAIDIRKENIL